MGVFFSIFKRSEYADLIHNFDYRQWQEATPAGKDQELYDDCGAALERTPEMVQQLQDYKQCDDFIRKAMGEPTPGNGGWFHFPHTINELYCGRVPTVRSSSFRKDLGVFMHC